MGHPKAIARITAAAAPVPKGLDESDPVQLAETVAALRSRVAQQDRDFQSLVMLRELTQKALEETSEQVAQLTAERNEAYVPGKWICPTCGFVQAMLTLNAHTGAVGVSREPALPCPNDGQFMERQTWKAHALDVQALCERLLTAERAERERAERAEAGSTDSAAILRRAAEVLRGLTLDGEDGNDAMVDERLPLALERFAARLPSTEHGEVDRAT